jgi:hypothetical protein
LEKTINKTVCVVLISLSTWWALPVFAQEEEEAEPAPFKDMGASCINRSVFQPS